MKEMRITVNIMLVRKGRMYFSKLNYLYIYYIYYQISYSFGKSDRPLIYNKSLERIPGPGTYEIKGFTDKVKLKKMDSLEIDNKISQINL